MNTKSLSGEIELGQAQELAEVNRHGFNRHLRVI